MEAVALTHRAVDELRSIVQRQGVELQYLREQIALLKRRQGNAPLYVGKANGTISGISGNTLGTGTMDIYIPDVDRELQDANYSLPVLNPAGEISDGTVIGCQSGAYGSYFVTVENCPTS